MESNAQGIRFIDRGAQKHGENNDAEGRHAKSDAEERHAKSDVEEHHTSNGAEERHAKSDAEEHHVNNGAQEHHANDAEDNRTCLKFFVRPLPAVQKSSTTHDEESEYLQSRLVSERQGEKNKLKMWSCHE
jgi:hypothetical protein